MPDPDQSGSPTWGALAVPSQLSLFSPGLAAIGAMAYDTGQSANRARNMAAFEAYQRMNPGATAADLSAAAERLTGGDNFFGTSANSNIMQEIADKNQLALKADQAKQQSDINTGYLQAMDQAIATADTPEDWVAKTKSFLAPNTAGAFDTYMAPKDSASMFKVYQQKRVVPLVDAGIKAMWDTPDQYTIAAGGNASLGKMAYDMAKPLVDAQKQKIADEHGLSGAQIGAEHAREAAGYASAGESAARTAEANQQTQALITESNAKRVQFLNDQLADPLIADALATQDPANLERAKQALHDRYVGVFGPGHDDDLNSFLKTAPAEIASRTAAQKNAQAIQTGQLVFNTEIAAPTAGLRTQVSDTNSWELGTDQSVLGSLSGDEKKSAVRQTASNTRALLADKDVSVSDTTLFKKIVAEDTVAGKSLSEIQRHLETTLGSTGLPIYGNSAMMQSVVTSRVPGMGAAPMSAPELQQQISSNVRDVVIQTDGLINTLTKPKGMGGMGGVNLGASVKTVTDAVTKSLSDIDTSIAQIRDRNSTGLIYDKDKSTLSYLLNQRTMVEDKARELRRVIDKQKIKVDVPETPKVAAGGGEYEVNTDLGTVDPTAAQSVVAEVGNVVNQQGSPRGNALVGATAPSALDNSFLPYLQTNPDAARLTALAVQEVNRIQQQSGTVGVPSLKMGQFSRSAPQPSPGQKLSQLQIGQIVGKIIGGNLNNLPWGQEDRAFLQDQITKLIMSR